MTHARWPAAALAALLAGCASLPSAGPPLGAPLPEGLPATHELEAVPFFPQRQYHCGPAALATVLGAAGRRVTPDELAPQVYVPGRQGSLQLELLGATRRHGLVPYVLPAEPAAPFAAMAGGHPVLVLQNLGIPSVPYWHYAVLVGYDAARGRMVLRSGRDRREVMRGWRFQDSWRWGGRWGVVALAPGELPDWVEPQRYVEAVAGLEAAGQREAAAVAYRAALARWPGEARAWLGLGNVEYAAGRRAEAAQAWAESARQAPADPVARNNLAVALAELGCGSEARAQAARAVALAADGPFAASARRTVAQVAAAPDGACAFAAPLP